MFLLNRFLYLSKSAHPPEGNIVCIFLLWENRHCSLSVMKTYGVYGVSYTVYVTWSRGWVGCRRYSCWDIGNERVQIPLFYIVSALINCSQLCNYSVAALNRLWKGIYIYSNSVTRYPIIMGFASKCSISKLPENGVQISKLKIFDMRLISLDRITLYSFMFKV